MAARKFVPSFKEHLVRYAFAMPFAYKRDVLDAGSKEGFGAHMLSYGANTVTLSDISQGYLDAGKKWFNFFCPVEFVQCDFNKGFPEGEWDTIVSFEVIEHVKDPDFFVKNIAEHLLPGGHLVFSVPHMCPNHEHITLFDEEKIRALIERHLDLVVLHVQDKQIFSGEPLYKGLKCYVGVARKRMV